MHPGKSLANAVNRDQSDPTTTNYDPSDIITSMENVINDISNAFENKSDIAACEVEITAAAETTVTEVESTVAEALARNQAELVECYCIFCRSGQERSVVSRLKGSYPEMEALAPLRIVPEKRDGKWTDREHVLLPGYVFVYALGRLPVGIKQKEPHIYRLLDYDEDMRSLFGEDREYAMWLLRHHGQIVPSKVLCQGDEVTVVDGPLKDCQGTIKKLDKHKRRAWISFKFAGEIRTVSLGVEFLQ